MSSEPGNKANGQNAEESSLQLDLHTDESVWMRQIGHLKDWCAQTQRVKLGVPALVSTSLAASSIRLLFLFKNLQHLEINFNSTRSRIDQPILVACAELLNLSSLHVGGGHLGRHGLDLGVLTSLRALTALAVRPHSDEELDGLEDEHLASAARLTGLRSLSLRASENVTDEGVMALTALTGLTQLTLVPMGLCVTREGITALSAAMPRLAALSVGLHESRQVAALKGLADRPSPPLPPRPAPTSSADTGASGAGAAAALPPPPPLAISVVLNSPEVSTSGFFSTLTLVLRPSLVSLRMATVESTDASFLLAVGTLVHLTELKMGVSLPEGGQPYTCSLAALSSLGRLQTLEFAVTQDLRLPLSVKMVSMLALSWPRLRSLSLSVMAKPEVVPEALDLLDNFRGLDSLSLFAPLDYSCDEDAERITLPVTLRYLPPGLTHLVLECAHLQDPAPGPVPAQPGPHSHPQQQHSGTGGGAHGHNELQQEQGQHGEQEAAEAGGSGAQQQPAAGPPGCRPLLPRLQHLELTSCHISEDHLAAVLRSATGVRHLEFNDVRGVTDTALASLSGLTRLEHLVMRLGPAAAAPATAPAPQLQPQPLSHAPGSPAPIPASAPSTVTHRALAALRNVGSLRHLEWSLAEPLGGAALQELTAPGGLLASLGGLQELALDVAPELRVAGPGRRLVSGAQEEVGQRAEGGEGGWRERLQRSLPLCTIADRPGIVLYDLWNDRTMQVVGP